MKFTYFDITNFKGIEHIRLDFTNSPKQNIYTLVGLNESGKTTILEAINFFRFKNESLDPLELKGYNIEDIHDLIPICKRDNFNDSIILEIGLQLDKDDEDYISKRMSSQLSILKTRDIEKLTIKQIYPFSNSNYNENGSKFYSSFSVYGKKKGGSKERLLTGETLTNIMSIIKDLIPSILYFPNFLFDFPDKIYLEKIEKDEKKHNFFRLVIQDILDSLDNNLNIEEHIIKRARSEAEKDIKNLQTVLLKMSKKVTKEVFDAWDKIFKKSIQNKEINIRHNINPDIDNVYLEFVINDGEGIYQISERSLGFRWFFVFLLLTQFRKHSKRNKGNTLFLLDEPASNLHSSAQAQLLKSFENLPSLIYTTHSHHMINPLWLEGTYVVKNEGLNYENEDTYSSKKTKIVLSKYREFASKHPDQTNYFKPILDVLDYAPSKLEFTTNAIFVEGKYDFYHFNYFQKVIFKNKYNFTFIPGTSSSHLDNLISLYLGWAKNFIVILDSDKEGKQQKKRYLEEFGILLEGKIFCFNDIDTTYENLVIEKFYDETEIMKIQKNCYPSDIKFNKGHLNRSVQELLLKNQELYFNSTTINKFKNIFEFLKLKLNG